MAFYQLKIPKKQSLQYKCGEAKNNSWSKMRRSSVSRLVGRSVPIKAFEGHLDQSRHASNEAANVAHAHNY